MDDFLSFHRSFCLEMIFYYVRYYADGWEYVEYFVFSYADNFSALKLVFVRILLFTQLTHNKTGENRC